MPVTFTFKRVCEEMPAHDQEIIWLRKTSSYGFIGFDPISIKAEYQWMEYIVEDGKKSPTGNSICYSEEYPSKPENDGVVYELELLLDGYVADGQDLWISSSDYWEALGE